MCEKRRMTVNVDGVMLNALPGVLTQKSISGHCRREIKYIICAEKKKKTPKKNDEQKHIPYCILSTNGWLNLAQAEAEIK